MSSTATRQFEQRQVRRPSAAVASATEGRRNLVVQHLGNQSLQRLLQAKLTVSDPDDVQEREADRVADAVLRMPEPAAQIAGGPVGVVQRACSTCEEQLNHEVMEEDERLQEQPLGRALQRRSVDEQHLMASATTLPPVPLVDAAMENSIGMLSGRGSVLPDAVRSYMEPRFQADFSAVRVHTDTHAQALARSVNAQAFTVGNDVVFGAGYYAPQTAAGKHLLAHELTHVIQQSHEPMPQVQRVPMKPLEDPRPPAGAAAPKATSCGKNPDCPPGFCDPFATEFAARRHMLDNWWWIRLGIAASVDSRVLPLWDDFVGGGTAPQDLTSTFGGDFTLSPTTFDATDFLLRELRSDLIARPPALSAATPSVTLDIPTRIPKAIAALGDPASANQMNFNIPSDIPGNIAGGIGTNQTACPAGAKPSPFNDERTARGSAVVTQTSSGMLVIPSLTYTVKDTIDLCPGNCGTLLEQVATVPLSQWEATGIAGDVPFSVEFPAIAVPFSIP